MYFKLRIHCHLDYFKGSLATCSQWLPCWVAVLQKMNMEDFFLLWRQFLLGGTAVGKLGFLQQRFSVASEIGVVVTLTLISGSKLTGRLPEVNISRKDFPISCFLIVSNVVSCLGRLVLWSFSGVIPTGL